MEWNKTRKCTVEEEETHDTPSMSISGRSDWYPYADLAGHSPMLSERSCFTRDGNLGYCTSVRSCYPTLALPPLHQAETWAILSSGTCHYARDDGSSLGLRRVLLEISHQTRSRSRRRRRSRCRRFIRIDPAGAAAESLHQPVAAAAQLSTAVA